MKSFLTISKKVLFIELVATALFFMGFCAHQSSIHAAVPSESSNNFSTLAGLTTACFVHQAEHNGPIDPLNWPKSSINALIPAKNIIAEFNTFFSNIHTQVTDKGTWLNNHTTNAKNFMFPPQSQIAYVQKMIIPVDSTVCFIGDLHGSIHSLLRNLWRLVALGYLDNNFKICKPNFYMIFCGDFVDRGRYGIECWYTLLKIKNANPNNVVLLRGNHEHKDLMNRDGFSQEIKKKYPLLSEFRAIQLTIFRACNYLPLALYLGSNNEEFFQCCHGGIEKHFNPEHFLNDATSSFCFVETLSNGMPSGFNWSDFCQSGSQFTKNTRGVGIMAPVIPTLVYLAGCYKENSSTKLKGFFRGHQDMGYGCKMLFHPTASTINIDKARQAMFFTLGGQVVDDGPFHWSDVVSEDEAKKCSFIIGNTVPIFTFTTAAEARTMDFDCFTLVTTAKDWQQWVVKPYEIFLNKKHFCFSDENYVVNLRLNNLNYAPNCDPIMFHWASSPIVPEPVDAEIIEKSNNNRIPSIIITPATPPTTPKTPRNNNRNYDIEKLQENIHNLHI